MVVQDVRGRYGSDGEFRFMMDEEEVRKDGRTEGTKDDESKEGRQAGRRRKVTSRKAGRKVTEGRKKGRKEERKVVSRKEGRKVTERWTANSVL